MKTLFINGSPKKKFSASEYFIDLQKFFIKGEIKKEKLRNKNDHECILSQLNDIDTVIFAVPLYVDGIPSHVLAFMKVMEKFCKENCLHIKLYVISNSGFIEGNQSRVLMRIFENFCVRSGIEWGGGIGIGGGVMLNVMRIVFVIQTALFLINMIISGFNNTNLILDYLNTAGLFIFFNLGVFFYAIRMGISVNRKKYFGEKYTRILIPSFVFIIFADIFFVIISVFQGGIFRGWLSKK